MYTPLIISTTTFKQGINYRHPSICGIPQRLLCQYNRLLAILSHKRDSIQFIHLKINNNIKKINLRIYLYHHSTHPPVTALLSKPAQRHIFLWGGGGEEGNHAKMLLRICGQAQGITPKRPSQYFKKEASGTLHKLTLQKRRKATNITLGMTVLIINISATLMAPKRQFNSRYRAS